MHCRYSPIRAVFDGSSQEESQGKYLLLSSSCFRSDSSDLMGFFLCFVFVAFANTDWRLWPTARPITASTDWAPDSVGGFSSTAALQVWNDLYSNRISGKCHLFKFSGNTWICFASGKVFFLPFKWLLFVFCAIVCAHILNCWLQRPRVRLLITDSLHSLQFSEK